MMKFLKRAFLYICLFTCIFFIPASVHGQEQKNTTDGEGRLVSMPSPAAVYSAKMGYKYELRKEGDSVVIFPDGTECNAWAFFRGKAGQKRSYCQQHGGKIENRVQDLGSWTAEYAVCVFSDGSECYEMDYIDGECAPGQYKKWEIGDSGRFLQ
ncbi:MAG: DUF333 domain-containing protein [Candidatus Omnitrophota bacterium]